MMRENEHITLSWLMLSTCSVEFKIVFIIHSCSHVPRLVRDIGMRQGSMCTWERDLTHTSSSRLLCTRTSSGSRTAINPFDKFSTASVPNKASGSILWGVWLKEEVGGAGSVVSALCCSIAIVESVAICEYVHACVIGKLIVTTVSTGHPSPT